MILAGELQIKNVTVVENQPVLYYLEKGPTRSFVREELQIISSDSDLPPKNI